MTRSKKILLTIVSLVLLFGVFWTYQFFMLRKAHNTFDNYYAFRGCETLIQKTDTYGVCETKSGETIKIVEARGAWYLDGDLPTCFGNFCF